MSNPRQRDAHGNCQTLRFFLYRVEKHVRRGISRLTLMTLAEEEAK